MRLEKARYSVGVRQRVGFWLAILVALLCVWLIARWNASEIDIETLQPKDVELLERAQMRVFRGFKRGSRLQELTTPIGRGRPYFIVIYEAQQNKVYSRPFRFLNRLENDIQRLSTQETPLRLGRNQYKLIGPKTIVLGEKQYLLFLCERINDARDPFIFVITLLVVLFASSVIYSIVFTRSLLRPVAELRNTALDLANGKWDARVDLDIFSKDELGELASTFNDMAQKIDSNWHSQRRLLADISHELRSPLARLNMAIALTDADQQLPPTSRASLLRIEKETAKMDKLIGDVLKLARTESDMSQQTQVSMIDLLADVLENAEFEAAQKSKDFSVSDVPELLIHCQIDALQSAIENVIRNAIRYTSTMVDIAILVKQESWQITVNDDGPGLTEVEINNIFTPFYRSDSARNSKTGGVGLGLAITQAAVHNHKGQITAESRVSGGLSVTITLPIHLHA